MSSVKATFRSFGLAVLSMLFVLAAVPALPLFGLGIGVLAADRLRRKEEDTEGEPLTVEGIAITVEQCKNGSHVAQMPLDDGTVILAVAPTRKEAIVELLEHYLHDLKRSRPEGDEKHQAPPLEVLERRGDEVDPEPSAPSSAATFAEQPGEVIPLHRASEATFRQPLPN